MRKDKRKVRLMLKNDLMITREVRVTKTYFIYCHTAFSCDDGRHTATVGLDVIIQVTARSVKVLSEQGI